MGVLNSPRVPHERLRSILCTAETHDSGYGTCAIFTVVYSSISNFNGFKDLNKWSLVFFVYVVTHFNCFHLFVYTKKVLRILTFAPQMTTTSGHDDRCRHNRVNKRYDFLREKQIDETCLRSSVLINHTYFRTACAQLIRTYWEKDGFLPQNTGTSCRSVALRS